MLDRHVLRFLREHDLVRSGDVLLLGASGGPDSTALLHVLRELAEDLDFRLELAHLDHGVRGAESRADARFTADLAAELGLTLHHRTLRHHPDGRPFTEERMRRARRAFLREAARIAGARWIVTGHTADDQAETFLLNLLRGAGPRGLGGMLPVGPGPFCRPFLGVWKEDVLEYLEERDLPYRIDATNADLAHRRNRVRHRVLPLLEAEIHPRVRRVLAREAAIFAEIDAYLGEQAPAALDMARLEGGGDGDVPGATGDADPDDLVLNLAALEGMPAALRRAALREALVRASGPRRIRAAHVAALLRLATGRAPSAEAHLGGGLRAERRYDRLVLTHAPAAPVDAVAPPAVVEAIDTSGEIRWGSWLLSWTRAEADPAALPPLEAAFDPGQVVPPLTIRGARPGDRLAPWGMTGHRKASDLLTEARVPARGRPGVAVLCDNGGPSGSERLLWIVGVRRSRHAPVLAGDRHPLVIRAIREPEAHPRG